MLSTSELSVFHLAKISSSNGPDPSLNRCQGAPICSSAGWQQMGLDNRVAGWQIDGSHVGRDERATMSGRQCGRLFAGSSHSREQCRPVAWRRRRLKLEQQSELVKSSNNAGCEEDEPKAWRKNGPARLAFGAR